jgi:hypothetical protein
MRTYMTDEVCCLNYNTLATYRRSGNGLEMMVFSPKPAIGRRCNGLRTPILPLKLTNGKS